MALVVLGMNLAISGCQTVLIETGKKAFEDRSTGDQVTDTKLASSIAADLAMKDKSLLLDVNADVWEQRVLLTGTLSDPRVKEEVVAMVRGDQRVRELYDEIQIVSPEEQEQRRKAAEEKDQGEPKKEGFGQTVNDFWIETKISARLLTEPGVRSVNFRWRSVRDRVYVIGRARSEDELQRVLEICRNIDGVLDVKHLVQVRPVS
jgi:osmotically-inducible protein OsmY